MTTKQPGWERIEQLFRAGELFRQVGQIEGVDPRLQALAKINLQQGFM